LFEKEFGDAFCGDGFVTGTENYPLHKPMVDHNHDRIKTRGDGEVGNEVNGELSERVGRGGGDRDKRWCRGVGVDFHLLASSTTVNVVANKSPHGRPPVQAFNKLFGAETARMTRSSVAWS
jgi:hypothetical protein